MIKMIMSPLNNRSMRTPNKCVARSGESRPQHAIDYSFLNEKNTLYLIAFTAMIIDHVGAVFFPQLLFLQYFGRLALPVFCWGIGQAFIYSSNYPKYVLKLLIFGVLSQPLYYQFWGGVPNAILYLFVGAISLYIYDRFNEIAILTFLVLLFFTPFDFIYIALQVLAMYVFRVDRKNMFKVVLLINCSWSMFGVISFQWLSCFAVFLFFIRERISLPTMPKNLFWYGYPGHLAIMIIIFVFYR